VQIKQVIMSHPLGSRISRTSHSNYESPKTSFKDSKDKIPKEILEKDKKYHSTSPSDYPKTLTPTSALSENDLRIASLSATLTQQFLNAKEKMPNYSGYQIILQPAKRGSSFNFTIHPYGEKDQPISPPGLTSVVQCDCCSTGFEHTFKFKPSKHCIHLSKQIEKYGMLAVSTPNKILLIVPRVNREGIEGFRHMFELDKDKLIKVFSAAIESMDFIKGLYPFYKPHLEWHVGSRQSVGLLHTRIHNLPKPFFKKTGYAKKLTLRS
jgi:hypothetical protein